MCSIKFQQSFLMWLKKFFWQFDLRKLTIIGSIIIVAVLTVLPFVSEKRVRYLPCRLHPSAHDPCRFNQDNSGLPFHEEIVPNIVHFYRSGKDVNYIGFVDAVCLLAAFQIIKPDKIIIHTEDVLAVTYSFSKSSFSRRLMQVPGFKRVLDVQYWPAPKHVFGIEFSSIYRNNHISGVTRLRILRKYGGIFLDNHAFVTRNPHELRHYEMSLLDNEGVFTNNMIVGHRDARLLDVWLKSYHHYDPLVSVHHHTNYVKSLFLQKSTQYHRFEYGVRQSGVSILTDYTEMQKVDDNDCYVIFINVTVTKEEPGLNDESQFGSEDIIGIVRKQMDKYNLEL